MSKKKTILKIVQKDNNFEFLSPTKEHFDLAVSVMANLVAQNHQMEAESKTATLH